MSFAKGAKATPKFFCASSGALGSPMPLQFLDDKQVQINGRIFRFGYFDPPFKDGNTHLVEATSDPGDHHKQKMSARDLKGILGEDLPKGFQLSIYLPEAKLRGVDFVTFENLLKGPRITLIIYVNYQSWENRLNLYHFTNDLCLEIEKRIANCQTADVSRSEYGVSLQCSFTLGPKDDCSDSYDEIVRQISVLYKQLLNQDISVYLRPTPGNESASESRGRWWIRYVAVPILSGGVGVALVSWLITKLSQSS